MPEAAARGQSQADKEAMVEKYIKKSLFGEPVRADAKYKICSKCGATIPMETRVCVCGAEYSNVAIMTDIPAMDGGAGGPTPDQTDAKIDAEIGALTENFDSAENELEKIAEEIALAVKGDIKRKEDKFSKSAGDMQDTLMRLQQEIADMRDGFSKISEEIANEVREEIKKHEEGKIQAIESHLKDTLTTLQAEMKRESASLKEDDAKVKTAKKELYDEVSKLMEHLKKSERDILEREKAFMQKEAEFARREAEFEEQRKAAQSQASVKGDDAKKAEDEYRRQMILLKAEHERERTKLLKSAEEEWRLEEQKMKAEIEQLKAGGAAGGADGSKAAEIAKLQSKILVAVLKENPQGVLKVIKALNISKEDLKKLMG